MPSIPSKSPKRSKPTCGESFHESSLGKPQDAGSISAAQLDAEMKRLKGSKRPSQVDPDAV